MADEVNAASPASAAAPVVAATPTKTVQELNAQREATVGKQPVPPGGDPAAAEVASRQAVPGDPKPVKRGSTIVNAAPIVDPDAPVTEKKIDESTLSPSTLAEMEAGRNGLKRGRPGAPANRPLQPANPVDAANRPVDPAHRA